MVLSLAGKSVEELFSLFFLNMKDDDDYYHTIANQICLQNNRAFDGVLDNLSDRRIIAVINAFGLLEENRSDWHLRIIIKHLSDPRQLVVSAAIDALSGIGFSDWSAIEPLIEHPSPFVRGATLRFASSHFGAQSVSILLNHVADSSPIVRQNVIDELANIDLDTAKEVAIKYLTDKSRYVRQAAKSVLN
jgi:HEAT repeat protein